MTKIPPELEALKIKAFSDYCEPDLVMRDTEECAEWWGKQLENAFILGAQAAREKVGKLHSIGCACEGDCQCEPAIHSEEALSSIDALITDMTTPQLLITDEKG